MTNEELLIAISNMMDEKLDANLTPMRNDIAELKTDIAVVKERVSGLEIRVTAMEANMTVVKEKVSGLEAKVTKIQLTQENSILPRLQNIEACYIGTYNRYLNDSERMETAFEDIGMLKTAVAEHSEKLKYVS